MRRAASVCCLAAVAPFSLTVPLVAAFLILPEMEIIAVFGMILLSGNKATGLSPFSWHARDLV